MNDSNVIIAALGGGRTTVTAKRYMTDYGQVLKIIGTKLPDVYRVDFSNDEHKGDYVRMIGNADGVLIPKQFFESGRDIWAFLVSVTANAERTVAKIRILNARRPNHNVDPQPEPAEQDALDTAIVEVNRARQMLENVSATAFSLPEGADPVATYSNGLFTFGIPAGGGEGGGGGGGEYVGLAVVNGQLCVSYDG